MNCSINCLVRKGISRIHSTNCHEYRPAFRSITGNDAMDYELNVAARQIQEIEDDDSIYDPHSLEPRD